MIAASGAVIEYVWRNGGVFQEWNEHFDYDLWLRAAAACNVSIDWYVHRHRSFDEVLPWDHISAGLHKDFLWQDWRDALERTGPRRLPLDTVLRLWRVHRLRPRAHRRVGDTSGRRQPGHRPRPHHRRRRSRAPAGPATGRSHAVRVRLRFTKRGKIRFTSHRDTARVWERTVRRAQLPIAYSQGFSPHAKLSFGLALSTGFESDAEYLDIELDPARADQVDIDALPPMLSALLPDGMTATAVAVLPPGSPSLQQIVTSCEYLIDLAIDEFVAPATAGGARRARRRSRSLASTRPTR